MNVNPFRRGPADREQLARLLPAPAERDLPGGRHHALREYLMHEIDRTSAPVQDRDPHVAPPRRGRRLALAGAFAAAVAVAAAFGPALVGDRASSQAWAVEDGPSGKLTVHIYEFTDAAGLEARLREDGIRAVVDYIHADEGCSYDGQLLMTPEEVNDIVGRMPPPASMPPAPSGNADENVVIPIELDMLPADHTLSIFAIVLPGQTKPALLRFGYLQGQVGHCESGHDLPPRDGELVNPGSGVAPSSVPPTSTPR